MRHDPFTQSVIMIIKKIPKGKVISYGAVAGMAGNKRGARQVSWILHSMSEKCSLPWWRVVNSKGKIAIRPGEAMEIQRAKLEAEGVQFAEDNCVDLDLYMWESNTKIEIDQELRNGKVQA
jgi:methylated-DNA-protein-cysteine methyltransferase related protein